MFIVGARARPKCGLVFYLFDWNFLPTTHHVSYAVLSMLFTVWTSIKTGRPEKARSITYYV